MPSNSEKIEQLKKKLQEYYESRGITDFQNNKR